MKDKLAQDYMKKSEVRIKALYFFLENEDYADVVREVEEECVELILKALLRKMGAEVPKIHDPGKVLEKYRNFLPQQIKEDLEAIKEISKSLRKEKELAFYGVEDFIPTEEYTEKEAKEAIKKAEFIFSTIKNSKF